jgi:hypothetical protein
VRHGGSAVVTLKALGRDVLPANGNSARDSGVIPPKLDPLEAGYRGVRGHVHLKASLCKVDVEDFDIQQRRFAARHRYANA